MFSKYSVIYAIALLLVGCGSSSSPETIVEEVVEETIEEGVVEEQEDILCLGLARLEVNGVTATEALSGYPASNAIDQSFISDSRWSTYNLEQSLILTLNEPALVKGLSITWFNEDSRSYSYDVEVSKDQETWLPVLSNELSDQQSTRAEFDTIAENTANYIKIIPKGNTLDDSSQIVEVEVFGCHEDITSPIALDDWYLSIPVDANLYSKAESVYESVLTDDYFNAEFFFNSTDGGLVFRSPIEGAKTSTNTSYTRTELREMLRRGDTSVSTQGINANNWVFSSASTDEQDAAGGVDGELMAELAVNHVTDTGDRSQVGRVIIGQIHANDDEPIRVYYRKLPENDKGAIYLAHEILGGDDIYSELIGTRSKSADNPANGIALNERFGYKITVVGNQLTFTIVREGQADITETVDMSGSGYDIGGQYMYFKAGVYNQNNTGDPKDYVQATFYKIDNSHTGYMGN